MSTWKQSLLALARSRVASVDSWHSQMRKIVILILSTPVFPSTLRVYACCIYAGSGSYPISYFILVNRLRAWYDYHRLKRYVYKLHTLQFINLIPKNVVHLPLNIFKIYFTSWYLCEIDYDSLIYNEPYSKLFYYIYFTMLIPTRLRFMIFLFIISNYISYYYIHIILHFCIS